MPLTYSDYQRALDETLAYGKQQGYAGYSKFDAMNSPLLNALSLGISPLQWAATQAVYRFPLNIRPLLGVKKGINPKAMGLFALGYLLGARAVPAKADAYIAEARTILAWLMANRAEGYSGMSCGYNYIWPNLRFTAPANFPNLVVTGNVILAFLTAYEQLGDAVYLETARSSVDFILKDLNTLVDTREERAISYVPDSKWIVLNNQGLAAVVMAWVAKHTGETFLVDLARRHLQFLVNQQTEYGAWYYAYPPNSSPVTHDNYHTGNVLDWLLLYKQHTGDTRFEQAYMRGLEFYRDHLFLPDGAPKHRHNVNQPHDVHSSAQGGITFSRAALHYDQVYLPMAQKVLAWGLANLRANDGGFYYMKGRLGVNRTRLMHWNEGLMTVSMATTMLAMRETVAS
jgi:rhamnogalacturonyl hydrolase YesR